MSLRIATAAVGLPLLTVVVWIGSPWLSLFAALAAALGTLEVCHMARQRGRRPMAVVAAVWAVAFVAGAHFLSSGTSGVDALVAAAVTGAVAGAGALVSLAWLRWHSRYGAGLADWGVSAGAALYTGGLLAYAPLIRDLDHGREWVLLLVFVTVAADTGAFFVGKGIGKRALAPRLSPGKTWEGAVGGLLAAIGSSALLAQAFDLDTTLAHALVLGGLMGVVGQLGDLAESRLKRLAGVKESGWLIPGHGGVLDRLDSIVLNLALVYYFVIWVVQ